MRILLLALIFVSLVAATTRFRSTEVVAHVVLRCKHPRDPIAKVFLMERDFEDSPLDEDDTMDFGNYQFGVTPEMKLGLQGEEFEITGLDPYIYVTHTCTKESNTLKTYSVSLMNSMYYSRSFQVIIDLDTGKSVVIPRLLY